MNERGVVHCAGLRAACGAAIAPRKRPYALVAAS